MRASPESPRMFQSDFLDFFTRTPWYVVPIVWIPVATASLWRGVAVKGIAAPVALAVVVLFFGVWTLAEYVLHRFVFHWKPATSWGPRFHFFVHGVHHDWPADRYRLVMPPMVGATLGPAFFGLFWLLLGSTWVWPAFAGFIYGYTFYDCTHYALHHFRWSSSAFKRLKAHHMNHHHNRPDLRFGVSNTFWDRVFGTL